MLDFQSSMKKKLLRHTIRYHHKKTLYTAIETLLVAKYLRALVSTVTQRFIQTEPSFEMLLFSLEQQHQQTAASGWYAIYHADGESQHGNIKITQTAKMKHLSYLFNSHQELIQIP